MPVRLSSPPLRAVALLGLLAGSCAFEEGLPDASSVDGFATEDEALAPGPDCTNADLCLDGMAKPQCFAASLESRFGYVTYQRFDVPRAGLYSFVRLTTRRFFETATGDLRVRIVELSPGGPQAPESNPTIATATVPGTLLPRATGPVTVRFNPPVTLGLSNAGTPRYAMVFDVAGARLSVGIACTAGSDTYLGGDTALRKLLINGDTTTLRPWTVSRRDVSFALGFSSAVPGPCATTHGATCDDGNATDGDGCSSSCQVEDGYTCAGLPSTCTDVDECAAGTDTCAVGEACTNTPGSFTCAPPGPGAGCVGTPSYTSTPTGSMSTARYYAQAVALADGRAIVTGGASLGGSYDPTSGSALNTATAYDPVSGTFGATETFSGNPRYLHAITRLADGRVLIAGGHNTNGAISDAHVRSAGGSWTAVAALPIPSHWPTAHLLPNGLALVAGGENGNTPLTQSLLFDPVAQTFTATGSLLSPGAIHASAALANGRVLYVGGYNGGPSTTAQLYDPTTNAYTLTGSMNTGRYVHQAVALLNGKVLVAGGYDAAGHGFTSAELYDPSTGTFTPTGAMATPRLFFTLTLLANGKVLAAGGLTAGGLPLSVTNTTEVYDPATGLWTAGGNLSSPRWSHTATRLDNCRVLIAGGSNGSTPLSSAEIFW